MATIITFAITPEATISTFFSNKYSGISWILFFCTPYSNLYLEYWVIHKRNTNYIHVLHSTTYSYRYTSLRVLFVVEIELMTISTL